MIPAFDTYLFDIDGTLLNSALDICGAVQQVLSATDERPTLSHEFLQGYIGRHLIDLFGDIFPHYSGEKIERMIQDYRTIYLARGHTQTAMPLHVKARSRLFGFQTSVVTGLLPNVCRA